MVNSLKQLSQIKLISECYVRPKTNVEALTQPHYLGPIDLRFLSFDQMQKGLLFPNKPKNFECHFIEKLKHSLSSSLVHFYPLAGQFVTQKFLDEHAIWVYVDCNKGPGARLIHASVDHLVCSDIISSMDVHPIIQQLFDFGEKAVNYDGHTRPLLSIQVTELLDGVFIGFTMNHSIADGTSLWNFISSLSEIFNQLNDDIIIYGPIENFIVPVSRKPILKTFFPNGYGPILKLPYLEPNEFITHEVNIGPFRQRIFHFSSISISTLKAKANQECNLNNQISSFQALSAFIWISITRARNSSDQFNHYETTCALATNLRSKINPPLSEDYFGGLIRRVQCSCKIEELLSKGLGWAATLINELVMGLNDKESEAFLKRAVEAPFVIQLNSKNLYDRPNNEILIGGSTKFDMYGPEFGLGKAIAISAGYANKEDGKVTANPGRKGGGSVDLEVCLNPETMSALENNEEFMNFVSVD